MQLGSIFSWARAFFRGRRRSFCGFGSGVVLNKRATLQCTITETMRMYRDVAVATNSTFLLQYRYVPSHVSISSNTAAGHVAYSQAHSYPMWYQSTRSVSLCTIKSIRKQTPTITYLPCTTYCSMYLLSSSTVASSVGGTDPIHCTVSSN